MAWKKKLTKIAFKLHGWMGLFAGLFFLLYGITGSMLMFRHQLDRYFNPELHQLKPTAHTIPADQLYRMVLRTHPNLRKLVLHDFPENQQDCYEFMLYKRQQKLTDNYLYYIFVNPYTGQIIREGSYGDVGPSFFRWLYTLHYSLQLGIPGMLLTAIMGIVMLLSLLTGVIVYRKHFWQALRFKAGLNFKNRRTAVSSLHRILGVWSLGFTAVLFFTGFWMLKEYFTPEQWALPKYQAAYAVPANVDSMIMSAKKIVPGFKPIAVNIPTTKGADVLVRGLMPTTGFFLLQGKASGLSFDAQTGKFKKLSDIDKQSFDQRFETEVYNLHIGSYGGDVIRWFYVILGLLPGILSVSGAILWFRRKY
ncbi:PepSY-associated TM helix domain-containing protein [Mucilaginibacter paludis]|uniref:PepSY-associated TM helix domain protein n=1 Tax=Mucilaginibacter paludis DSM 18603 TaxID=714943 RepID=H1YHJ0_9SPHI|nr:PepSY-associated TM helix domain-containing protein [Mucilaginibacter paludis]EHQ26413.1 PepSY-associated TM helix domain protein [Mucilaginibacter paludis DSM 18603]